MRQRRCQHASCMVEKVGARVAEGLRSNLRYEICTCTKACAASPVSKQRLPSPGGGPYVRHFPLSDNRHYSQPRRAYPPSTSAHHQQQQLVAQQLQSPCYHQVKKKEKLPSRNRSDAVLKLHVLYATSVAVNHPLAGQTTSPVAAPSRFSPKFGVPPAGISPERCRGAPQASMIQPAGGPACLHIKTLCQG